MLKSRIEKCSLTQLTLATAAGVALLIALAWPSAARAEVAVWVRYPGGATNQCSTPKVGRFTVEGPGLVTITTTITPYKALGRSPNIPTGYWVVGPGQPSFGPYHPLPGWDHTEYTQAGQDVSNKGWADGVPLVVKSFYKLTEAKRHVVDVQASPQCWMMPQNVYWQEGQEVRVEVNAEGGATVTATPPKDSETVEGGAVEGEGTAEGGGGTAGGGGETAAGGGAVQIAEIWNTANCDFTDTAMLTLDRPTNLNRIEVWYKWQPNETVSYTLSLNGKTTRSGSLVRGECDAYQRDWCIAADQLNMNLAPGTYLLRTRRAGICQNSGSGGKGFIRAFGTAVAEGGGGAVQGGGGTAGGEAGTGGEVSGAGPTPTQQADWSAKADKLRGQNGQRFTFVCPPGGALSAGVWGTDLYTDDSAVCVAAAHAGLITPQAGGTVTIEIREGASSYSGSQRNGVTSQSWGPYAGSFVVLGVSR